MPSEEDILKERIIAAAVERFRHEGFAKVSIDDLASNMMMSKKTFYKVFTSKEDLVEQIVNRILGDVATNLDRIVSSQHSFVAKLNGLLGFLGGLPARVGVPMMTDLQRQLPHIWKRLEDFRAQHIIEIFGKLVDQGMREGYVRPELNKRIFLHAYTASVQHIMQPLLLAHESYSAKEALQGILDLFFKGAMTDVGHREFEKLQRQNQQ